jgi:hypothetical protein
MPGADYVQLGGGKATAATGACVHVTADRSSGDSAVENCAAAPKTGDTEQEHRHASKKLSSITPRLATSFLPSPSWHLQMGVS